jgi:hypothetical protein
MSEHTPITGNLRQAMVQWGWADGREVTITDLQPSIDAEPFLTIRGGRFGELCDAIDAIHANLERENAALKEELDRVHGEQEEAEHRGWTRGYDEGFAAADDWMADNRDAMAEHGWVKLPKDADNVPWNVGDRDEDGNTVIELRLTSSGWCVMTDGGWFCYLDRYRHYQPPTVEDVLREFADGIKDQNADFAELAIAEYAKRLTLAEVEGA